MRNYYLDNIKVILIFLVVFGHMIEPLIDNVVYRNIYLIIYSFHMPVFIFVTGYFAKNNYSGIKKLWLLFFKYEIIYALVSGLLFIIFPTHGLELNQQPLWQLLLQPIWLLWYLLSLIWWRYLLVAATRNKIVIYVLIIAIITFNIVDFNFRILSIGRTLTFAPFFFAGYYVKAKKYDLTKLKKYRKIMLVFLIGLVIYWTKNIAEMQVDSLYGATSLISNYSLVETIRLKLGLYLIASYTGLVFMMFISSREESYSSIGSATLGVYIYHGLIILVLDSLGFFSLLSHYPVSISLTIILLLSLLQVKYLPKLKV